MDDAGAGEFGGEGGIGVASATYSDPGDGEGGQEQRSHLPADDAHVLVGGDRSDLPERSYWQLVGVCGGDEFDEGVDAVWT
jgi:hypothetical protein